MDPVELLFSDEWDVRPSHQLIVTDDAYYLAQFDEASEFEVDYGGSKWDKEMTYLIGDCDLYHRHGNGIYFSLWDKVCHFERNQLAFRSIDDIINYADMLMMIPDELPREIEDLASDGSALYIGLISHDILVADRNLDVKRYLDEANFGAYFASSGSFFVEIGDRAWLRYQDGIHKETLILGDEILELRNADWEDDEFEGVIVNPCTDSRNLYILTHFGDIWHITQKGTKLVEKGSSPIEAAICADNGEYCFVAKDDGVTVLKDGMVMGQNRLEAGIHEVVDVNAHGKFLYVLLEDRIQRYVLLR